MQMQVASPSLVWLRDMAIKVQRAAKLNVPLRAYELLELEGSDGQPDDDQWEREVRQVGCKMREVFKQGETVKVDVFTARREQKRNPEKGRADNVYVFTAGGQAVSPVSPMSSLGDELDEESEDIVNTQRISSFSSNLHQLIVLGDHIGIPGKPPADPASATASPAPAADTEKPIFSDDEIPFGVF